MATNLKDKLNKFKSGKHKTEDKCKTINNKCMAFALKVKLSTYLQQGLDIKEAAKLSKITDYQLGVLRSDPEFEDFIAYCSSECEMGHLQNINTAGSSGQWQASAWVLERRFPDRYGKKDTIKHEYEVKLLSFQKIILNVINDLDPNIRQTIMQKLRSINLESEMQEISFGEPNGSKAIAIG